MTGTGVLLVYVDVLMLLDMRQPAVYVNVDGLQWLYVAILRSFAVPSKMIIIVMGMC